MSDNKISISIHIAAILNISEFHNRMRVNYKSKRVYGGLIGEQHNNNIEVFAIFEFCNNVESGEEVDLDLQFLESRRKIAEQLYPTYDFLGFFSTNNNSEEPDKLDIKVFEVLEKQGVFHPINLVLNTQLEDKEILPLKGFKYDKNANKFDLVPVEFVGFESERICLNSINKSGSAQNNQSQIVQNIDTMKNAMSMLKSNLVSVLELVKKPELRSNPKFVELIDDLMKNYPNSNNNNNLEKFLKDSLDEMLIISNVTSTSVGINFNKYA